jgi:Predicted membrane protein
MKLCIGILLAILAILIGSPLLALVTGMGFALIFKLPDDFISKSIGTKFLQAGIVILGLTISASSALELTALYFPYISIFVFVVFLIGLLLGKIFNIEKRLALLIASGTAICGVTAMAAISPLIKAKPRELLVSMAIIFSFNALAIALFPLIANSIGMADVSFGAWAAMAIHDTSSVVGAAMAYGGDALEVATTLKLGRTIWLIPLIVILGIFYKDEKGTKPKFPIFVFIFILAIVLGSALILKSNFISIGFMSQIF